MNRRLAAAGLAVLLSGETGCAMGPSPLAHAAPTPQSPAAQPPAAAVPAIPAPTVTIPPPVSPPPATTAAPVGPAAARTAPSVTRASLAQSVAPAGLVAPSLPALPPGAPPATTGDPAVVRAGAAATGDPAVVRTGAATAVDAVKPVGDPTRPPGQPMAAAIATAPEGPGKPATMIAARVGDSVITLRELKQIVRERIAGRAEYSQLTDDQKNQIAREALEFLIDRAMLVQAARKDMKNPKQWDMFKQFVDKAWTDRELPALMKRMQVADEFELDRKLKERGELLSDKREAFLLDTMSREYATMKLQPRMEPPRLPDIYAYYRENLKSFDRPAQVTWREIYLPIDEKTPKAQARQAADAAMARLQRGEDFTKVARELSRSARAAEGGLWQTGYDSYASAAVNAQLKALPLNQVSGLIEDARGYYIVRVEARRDAGPAPFEEVERKITEVLMTQTYEKQLTVFLKDLRRRTPISSPLFEGTTSEPTQLRKPDATTARSGN